MIDEVSQPAPLLIHGEDFVSLLAKKECWQYIQKRHKSLERKGKMPRLEDLEERVDKLEETQTGQRESRLERDVRECKIGIQNVDHDVYDLSVRLEQVSDGLHAKIDGVEQRLGVKIDGVEKRLDAKIDSVASNLDRKIDMLAEASRLILVQLGIKPNGF